MDSNYGILYLVSTPIGNLKDITFRAVEVLGQVALIAAEDTRHTRKLLNHYEIKGKLVSYHDHNKEKSAEFIVARLMGGDNAALVSDAGTPGISDPGYHLVNLALSHGIKVTACPGPCAAVMALSISGLPTDRFSFFGFMPAKDGKRKNFLKSLANENKSMVFYETSGRIEDVLKAVLEELGDRYVVVTRELTKIFEETIRGKVGDLLRLGSCANLKGELTVIVSKQEETKETQAESVHATLYDLKDELSALLLSGASVKELSKRISEQYSIPKNEVYSFCLKLK